MVTRTGRIVGRLTNTWARLDPRPRAVAYPRLTVAAVLLVTAVMLYGNLVATKGGILDEPILDPHNPARQSELYVRSKRAEGFHPGEMIPIVLRFPRGISTAADLQRIRDFTERVKATFGPSVTSLSTVADYRDTGDELRNDPYVPAVVPADLDVAGWRTRVAADPSVYGILVGRDFEWATIFRYLPLGYDDIAEFRRTVEFLEGRQIPWWEWLYKHDIVTSDDVGVAGWVMGRGLLDQALTIDNLKLVSVGLMLALPLLVCLLGSVREAWIGAFGVVLLSVLWCRGSIGLLALAGFDVRERVYVLLAYTNCIVQGVSFVLHKFEAFHELGARSAVPRDVAGRWRRAVANDHLIGATGLISILGFATLYWFQVLAIRELGLLSALAVAYQVVLVMLWMPAVHLLTAGGSAARGREVAPRASRMLLRVLDTLVRAAGDLVTRLTPRRTAALATAATLGLALLATVLVWPGGLLHVKTVPINFITGTLVERTAEFMNAPGRLGFDARDFLIEPSDPGADLYDPAFLATAAAFQRELVSGPWVREGASILNQVRRVALESFGVALPRTREEARAVFGIIEADIETGVARQLFFPRGFRLTGTFHALDSKVMGEIGAHALEVARGYPALRVSTFGKSSLYPEVDRYVALGKPWNVLSSQLVVIALCWLGLFLNNRRFRASGREGPQLSALVGGVVMSVPFVFATALMVLLMIALDIPLDAATAAITALAINASIDFSIYFADAYQEGYARTASHVAAVRHALTDKGRIVLADMLLNTICFFPLVLSHFEPVSDLGWIMMVMLATCAFGTMVLMPAMLYLALPRASGATLDEESDQGHESPRMATGSGW